MYPIDSLYRGAQIAPDAVAVEVDGRTITYRELVRQVNALAAAFQDLTRGERGAVGICAPNSMAHVLGYLAALASGNIHVPLNPRNGKVELDAFIATTRPKIIVVDADCRTAFSPCDAILVGGEGAGADFAHTVAGLLTRYDGQAPQRPDLPLDATQSVKFTGGSTGRPKGVQQTFRVVNTLIMQYLATFRFGRADCFLGATPLTHAAGTYLLPMLAVGGRSILLTKPDAKNIVAAMRDQGVTLSFMAPTLIYKVMDEAIAQGRPRFPKLRLLMYGAAPMPVDRIRAAQDVFGPVMGVVYGQTEAPMMIAAMGPEELDESTMASVGRPCLPLSVAIMDDAGRPLPQGETGEVAVKGDLVMSGYLDNPEANAATLVDGWLRTGDVGALDERGYLFLKDRKRDVIITGGFNVYPTDVEGVLVRHPAVHEAVVFGLPDPKWGDRVEAAVQLRTGAAASAEELTAFVREALGAIKTPKRLHIVADLPRNSLGKVLRRELRAQYAEPAP